ncbi:MAG: LD-carboxypeptidase [Deltaproteobacteria bacterium]|nr:LD-carboxypeptidase [Deltaproteobacteria bacterium]
MKPPTCAPLKNGDIVELIVPSSGLSVDDMEKSKAKLQDWGLVPRLRRNYWNPDGLYSGSDQERFEELWNAIEAKDSKAIWCVRGGSGASRLLNSLSTQACPDYPKVFIGFSDATCLELFLAEKWGWKPIHGPNLSQIASKSVDSTSIDCLKDLLFGSSDQINLDDLNPINDVSHYNPNTSNIIGGNLSLVQASIGTFWQPKSSNRVLFLEDVGLRPYQIVEKLDHLHQAGLLNQLETIVLGTFTIPAEYGTELCLLEKALFDFACRVKTPVFRTSQIGHGERNVAIPNGGMCKLSRSSSKWRMSVCSE